MRTEAQERAVQGGGGAIHMHFYGPIADKQAFKKIVQEGMRDLGITDVTQYFRNDRSILKLGAV